MIPPRPQPICRDYSIPRGMILHRIGNVILLGGKELICSRVGESGATFLEIKNRGAIHHLSRCCEPSLIIRKEDFLPRKAGAKDKTNEANNDMKKEKKAKKVAAPKSGKNKSGVDFAGRAERVEVLVSTTKKTDKEILDVIVEEFPKSSPKLVMGCIAKKRLKLKKADKKESAKPAKAPKKPKAEKPAAEVPPPAPAE